MDEPVKMSRADLARLMSDESVLDRIFQAAAEAAVEEQLRVIREAEELDRVREAEADERSWSQGEG